MKRKREREDSTFNAQEKGWTEREWWKQPPPKCSPPFYSSLPLLLDSLLLLLLRPDFTPLFSELPLVSGIFNCLFALQYRQWLVISRDSPQWDDSVLLVVLLGFLESLVAADVLTCSSVLWIGPRVYFWCLGWCVSGVLFVFLSPELCLQSEFRKFRMFSFFKHAIYGCAMLWSLWNTNSPLLYSKIWLWLIIVVWELRFF